MTGNWGVVSSVQNPMTRNLIRLVPPIELRKPGDLDIFMDWIVAYCRAAWDITDEMGVHLDPKVIDATHWRDGEPVAL